VYEHEGYTARRVDRALPVHERVLRLVLERNAGRRTIQHYRSEQDRARLRHATMGQSDRTLTTASCQMHACETPSSRASARGVPPGATRAR
jgi:hypothetical protein